MALNVVLSICLSNHLSIILIDDFAKNTAPLMGIIFKGGIDMENGIYNRSEYRIVLYENGGAEPIVIVHNDRHADQPVILSGENAERLIMAIVSYLV